MTDEVIRVMLPRLGAHIRLWGSANPEHWCESDEPHDGPCTCDCGAVAPE